MSSPDAATNSMADEFERSLEAAAAIRARAPIEPAAGVILGSGLGAFGDSLDDAVAIPYDEIPHWPRSSVVGHSGRLVLGRSAGVPVAVLQGRAHYYEGHSLATVVFPVRVLFQLGIRRLVVTNAAGAIRPDFRSGSLMLINDHINLVGSNPMIGPNDERFGARFFDMTEAYDRALRDRTKAAAAKLGIALSEGVYVSLTGPSYETPAEIRMLRTLGADAVGMSTVPEVIAANHCGMKVLALSCLSNMAAGVVDQKLDHQEVLAAGRAVADSLLALLRAVLPDVAAA